MPTSNNLRTVLYVTGCSQKKKPEPRKLFEHARDLYDSPRIKTFMKKFPGPNSQKGFLSHRHGFLSHRHGFLLSDDLIKFYDQSEFKNFDSVVSMAKKYLDWFVERGLEKIIFYSPREITEKPWLKLLDAIGIPYEVVRSYKDVAKQ